MKILIVMHSSNVIYGAGKSLMSWISNSKVEYDILVRKTINNHRIDDNFINGMHNKPTKVMYEYLPFDTCYYGKEDMSIAGKVYTRYNNLMYILNKKKIENRILRNYDIVYLNSLVLWPMINDEFKCICHVREMFDGNEIKHKQTTNALNKSKAVIFIDGATSSKYNLNSKNIVLNNPFDMLAVSEVKSEKIYRELNIDKEKTVFSVFGRVSEAKGVEFIIDSFIKSKIDAYLLIAGDNGSDCGKRCVRKTLSHKNIIWLGERSDINNIYAITDYVIRGERTDCIGRTIFEGLYSGTGVILPGSKDVIFSNIDTDIIGFFDKIYCYEPRNMEELEHVFKKLQNKKIEERQFKSNVKEYIDKINTLIGEVYNEE